MPAYNGNWQHDNGETENQACVGSHRADGVANGHFHVPVECSQRGNHELRHGGGKGDDGGADEKLRHAGGARHPDRRIDKEIAALDDQPQTDKKKN